MKKGDVWISAVLYTALGIILLTLILSAGLPVMKKIKDKNTAVQTKDMMLQIDKSVRTVYSQGPGAQRPLTLDLRRGSLIIDSQLDLVQWKFDSTVLLSEPGVKLQEGNLEILTEMTGVEKQYETTFTLNYSYVVDLRSDMNEISGSNQLLISNLGI